MVAADDGPNAQTIEHLELLDALGIAAGLVVVTKADLVDAGRVGEVCEAAGRLVARTSLASSPVLAVSAATGDGVEALRPRSPRSSLGRRPVSWAAARLAVDRAFTVKGRGTVVTGSLRGGPVSHRDRRSGSCPARRRSGSARSRSGATRVDAADGGRTALLLGALEDALPERGQVLTAGPVRRRHLAAARRDPAARGPRHPGPRPGAAGRPRPAPAPPRHGPGGRARGPRPAGGDRPAGRLEPRDPAARRGGRRGAGRPVRAPASVARLDGGWRRRPGPAAAARGVATAADARAGGGAGATRSRAATTPRTPRARLDLHGAVPGRPHPRLAPDVEAELRAAAVALVAAHHDADPGAGGLPLATARASLALAARRRVTLGRADADAVATDVLDRMAGDGALARDGDRLRDPGRGAGLPPATLAAMDRLEAALAVAGPAAPRRGRARGGLPAGRPPGAGAGGPDRPSRGRPRVGRRDLPRPGQAGAGDGGGRAADARRRSATRPARAAGSCS